MKSIYAGNFNLDPGLRLTFVLLVGLIVGGNGLLIWQFHIGQLQAERVTRVSVQMASVLRLQASVLSFHQRLGELAQSKDASVFKTESEALRGALLEQIQQTRSATTPLPLGTKIDPLLMPTLDAVEIGLPAQIDAITVLASSGDWNAVNSRIDERLNPIESEASALVKSVDQDFVKELSRSESNMKSVQDRILVLVPGTAIYTFSIAAFFAWAIARKILELRVEERVNERTRIARELHDTLLQSFNGLLMRFQAVSNELDEGEPKLELDEAINRAARAITEGRDAVQGLRSSVVESNDLAAALGTLGKELAAGESRPPEFTIQVEGAKRDLHPILRDEVYRMAGEALRNAFHHAEAQRIEVEIRYDERQFRLRVRDDGKGFDPSHLVDSGRPGHFGLRGIRERATRVGGKLTVWSSDPRTDGGLESGTEVELRIPASRAYIRVRPPRRRWLAEKFSSKGREMDS